MNIKHALNGREKELSINNNTYKVDGLCQETNTIYKFYDCLWHGCPKYYKPNIVNSKNQNKMGTLNDQTIKKRETIKNAGYNHVSTHECQLAKNKDFQKFAKNFTLEVVETQDMLFMVEERMLPNCYTTLKKTSVTVTSTFAHCIQLFSSTKNIPMVIQPKYSTLKTITNLGTDLSNVKWSL